MIKTGTATTAVSLEMPPQGGALAAASTLEEDAHYLRVTLDKAENMKVAAGERLRDMLVHKFNNNRNELRDWYEQNVVQGKEGRAWYTVVRYLGVVLEHGERAAEVFEERDEKERERARAHQTDIRAGFRAFNEINDLEDNTATEDWRPREPKSEYAQRRIWLAQMDYTWFKGKPEWQQKWLNNRGLKSIGLQS